MARESLSIDRDPNKPNELVLLHNGAYVCNIPGRWRISS